MKKRMCNSNCKFSFKFETQEDISKLIQNLTRNKANQQYDITIKNQNNSLFSKVFPNNLKKADITTVFKKDLLQTR